MIDIYFSVIGKCTKKKRINDALVQVSHNLKKGHKELKIYIINFRKKWCPSWAVLQEEEKNNIWKLLMGAPQIKCGPSEVKLSNMYNPQRKKREVKDGLQNIGLEALTINIPTRPFPSSSHLAKNP